METYPRAAVERAMKVQEVIMRAMAKKITWAQAGEIIGLCDRRMSSMERAVPGVWIVGRYTCEGVPLFLVF